MIHLCAMSCISSVLTPFPPLFCNSEFLEWGPGEAAPGSGDRPHPLGPWVLGREADPDHDVDVAPEAGDGGKLHQHCLRGGGRQLHPPHPVWRPQLTAWIRSVALCVLRAHSNSLCYVIHTPNIYQKVVYSVLSVLKVVADFDSLCGDLFNYLLSQL